MPSPLIDALIDRQGYPVVDERTLPGFLETNSHSVLFFTEDPERYPESNDVAVILPELMKVFGHECGAAVIHRDAEKNLQKRFGFGVWPALVLMRGNDYLGAITRVQDWSDYLAEFGQLLAAEPTRPPGIGVPVVEEPGGTCH